jgi:hypothetical protein
MEQYRTGTQLEIYELDYTDNEEFHKKCKIKQPLVFDLSVQLSSFHHLNTIHPEEMIRDFGNIEICVKNRNEYEKKRPIEPVMMTLANFASLSQNQTCYWSENNTDFLESSGTLNYFNSFDRFIQPRWTWFTQRDVWFGSNTTTPLRFNLEDRHFLYVPMGSSPIQVKMFPLKNSEKSILQIVRDYYEFEFFSPLNLWDDESQNDLLSFIDFELKGGQTLYIPPYWWYTIRFKTAPSMQPQKDPSPFETGENNDAEKTAIITPPSFIYSIKYNTWINTLANSYHYANCVVQHLG